MGYTTEFSGQIAISPPLNAEEIQFMQKFSRTRRMACSQGPYYVDRGGFMGQGDFANPEKGCDGNGPPAGQPGLWCQWTVTDDGTAIEWDGGEKFYNATEWMTYIIDHFLGRSPIAKSALPFLQGHDLNGSIDANGEERDDIWRLVVEAGKVRTVQGSVVYA